MADFTVAVDDADLPDVVAALCFQASLPVSQANAEQAVISWISNQVVVWQDRQQRGAALAALPPVSAPTITPTIPAT